MTIIRDILGSLNRRGRQPTEVTLSETGRQWRRELDALAEIAAILTRPMDHSLKSEMMLAVLARTANSAVASLRTLNDSGSGLRLVAAYSPTEKSTMKDRDFDLPLSNHRCCPIARAFRERTTLVISDTAKLKEPMPQYYSPLYRSFLICPVQADENLVGMLAFSSTEVDHFHPDTVQLVTAVTGMLGALIENVGLQEERGSDLRSGAFANHELDLHRNREIQEREVEANIGRIVSSPQGIEDKFSNFATELGKLITYQHISIDSVDVEQQTVSTPFVLGENTAPDHGAAVRAALGGVALDTARSAESAVINRDSPGGTPEGFLQTQTFWDAGHDSILVMPLKLGEAVVGVLILARSGDPFAGADLSLAERVGPLLGGAMVNHDLNEKRKRAIVEAQENEARFRQIADNVHGGFWLSDLRPHKVVYVSPSVERIWGIPAGILYEKSFSWLDLVHPEDRERVNKAAATALITGELYEEFRIMRADGRQLWISSRGFPVKEESGDVYRIGGFVEDITERKETDRRLAEAKHMASIGELSAGVAHEINNPLTSIVLYSQMILDEDLPDGIRSDLQVVSAQAYRAANIVRNLLQFAKKSTPDRRPLGISGLISRAVEMKSHEFRINNITLVEDVPSDLPLIMMDEHLMIQVLLNILSNAEQACSSAHGRGQITVSATAGENSVTISIKDDGPGIPSDILSRVFEPFYTTKEVGSGAGLGLSVCLGILAQHEAAIWAASKVDEGATFYIRLPVTANLEAPALDDSSNSPDFGAGSKPARHILVVDDEPDLRSVLAKQLELRRYNVDQAGDGEEAWRKLECLRYDCILLDLRMPGMGGQGLYEKVNAAYPELVDRIIFVTGDTVGTATRAFLDNIANPVVSKPFDIRKLEQLVAAISNRDEAVIDPRSDVVRTIPGDQA